MEIYYKKSNKEKSSGDMKVLVSGKVFFREQRKVFGCYVVSNGKPCYEWFVSDHDMVKVHKENFDKKGYDAFLSTSNTKVQKGKTIRIKF